MTGEIMLYIIIFILEDLFYFRIIVGGGIKIKVPCRASKVLRHLAVNYSDTAASLEMERRSCVVFINRQTEVQVGRYPQSKFENYRLYFQ